MGKSYQLHAPALPLWQNDPRPH